MADITDTTLRLDQTGNVIIAKNGEHVMNVCTMLFNLRPGTDEYEPEKGLYITGKYFKATERNVRDSEYESEIIKQFMAYTDLIPTNVMALYINKALHIYLSVQYQGKIYEVELEHNIDTLSAVLRNTN